MSQPSNPTSAFVLVTSRKRRISHDGADGNPTKEEESLPTDEGRGCEKMAGGSQHVYTSFHNPRISAARACSVQSPYPGSGAR